MLERYECLSPRPDSRRATAVYKGCAVAVNVLQDVVREGSHIVVEVNGDSAAQGHETVEYVTDYAEFDEALSAGFEIARALIDEHRH